MTSRLYQMYIFFVNHSFGNLSELSDLFSVERKTIMRWVKKLRESGLIHVRRTKHGYKVEGFKEWDQTLITNAPAKDTPYKTMKEEFFLWKERVLNSGGSISIEEVTKKFGVTEITAKRWLSSDRSRYATLNGSHKANVEKVIAEKKTYISKSSDVKGMKDIVEGLEGRVSRKLISGGHSGRGALKSPMGPIPKKSHAVKSPIALNNAPKSPTALKSPIEASSDSIMESVHARAREINSKSIPTTGFNTDHSMDYSANTPAGASRGTFSIMEDIPKLTESYGTSGARKTALWIRQNVDAVELLSRIGVTLYRPKNSSGEWAGHCPLHDDRHPSFYVNERNGLWYCHACGVGGDVVELVKRMHGLRFGESVRWILSYLSNEAPSDVLHASAIEREPAQKKPVSFENRTEKENPMPKPFTSPSPKSGYAHTTVGLHEEAKGREYLAMRGIHEKTIKEFSVTVEDGNISIPLYDHEGENQGILYRMLTGKYRYRQDGGVTLFGVPQARKLAREELFVVEGVFDAMSIWQEGFPAVAIMRTGLNNRQVAQIKEFFGRKKIVFIPDNDEAGMRSAEENLRLLRAAGLNASIKFLPREFKDANEYLAQKQKVAQKMA